MFRCLCRWHDSYCRRSSVNDTVIIESLTTPRGAARACSRACSMHGRLQCDMSWAQCGGAAGVSSWQDKSLSDISTTVHNSMDIPLPAAPIRRATVSYGDDPSADSLDNE